MTVTASKLTRAAGLCAVAAGVLYVLVQFVHPHEDLANVTRTAWRLTHVLTVTMAVLALIGISGMYFRQVHQVGWPGLVGYLMFGAFFLATVAFAFVEAFILPSVAGQAPQFVKDVLALSTNKPRVGDVGGLDVVFQVGGGLYVLGGVVFGIALFRAGILSRWAAVLLSAGTIVALAAPVLPHAAGRMLALPVGLALAALGCSLWREPTAVHLPATSPPSARLVQAGAE